MSVMGALRARLRPAVDEPPPVASDAHVACRDVRTELGGALVHDGLTFTVLRGEFACLVGPSGCGKTTALRLIGGLLEQYEGELLADGQPPQQSWQRMAYVFQSPRLVPWGTALDNVLLGMDLRLHGVSAATKRERAMHWLTLVGLSEAANRPALQLSGGERHRVALARALAVEPQLLLMDEPFSDLDLPLRRRLRQELLTLWRQTGATVLFVTHDLAEAAELAQRIIVLSPKPARVLREIVVESSQEERRTDADLRGVLERELANLLSEQEES